MTRKAAPLGVCIVLALLAVYLIWGSTYLAIRWAVASLPPFMMAGMRFLAAGAVLYLALRLRGEPPPTRAQWGSAALIGVLLLTIGNGLVVYAEQRVASGLTAIALATMPLWAALFAGLWGNWPSRREWTGLALGFAGILFLSWESDLRANPLDALALLAAAAGWALGTVWSRHLPLPSGPMASATEMLAGGAWLMLLGLAGGERVSDRPGPLALWSLLYLIVFGSLIAFSAYNYLVRRVSPALATSNAYVNPLVAVGLGITLAGERIGWTGVLALIAILTGVGLIAVGQRQSAL